jgi:hypothetical protein
MEGQGAKGARAKAGPSWAWPGRARLGHTVGQNPVARTTTDRNPNAKQNPKRDEATHAIKHDIRQRNMPRHDATPMTT